MPARTWTRIPTVILAEDIYYLSRWILDAVTLNLEVVLRAVR